MKTRILCFVIFLFGIMMLTGCGFKEEMIYEEEIDSNVTVELTNELESECDEQIQYSNDPTANAFIEKYNELNPDNVITEDRVICPDNGGVYLTVIEFEFLDFCISEADGSPSFRCESILEYNDENTQGFFTEAFQLIRVIEDKLADEEIQEIIADLQKGEYPFDTFVSANSFKRSFSFAAPCNYRKQSKGNDKKQLTYNLSWSHASLY